MAGKMNHPLMNYQHTRTLVVLDVEYIYISIPYTYPTLRKSLRNIMSNQFSWAVAWAFFYTKIINNSTKHANASSTIASQ